MKILKIAPVSIPLNPGLKYGGIERVVLALSKSFVRKGHEVFVAAPKDSKLPSSGEYGTIAPTLERSEWTKPRLAPQDPDAYEKHIQKTIEYIKDLNPDVVHDHTGNFVLSTSFREQADSQGLDKIPIVVTPHEFQRFKKLAPPKQDNIVFTSLSEYQKQVFSDYVEIESVINNGVFPEEFNVGTGNQEFLFSIGSIEPDKGQDLAVKVALTTGIPLKIAGPIADQRFYDLEIKPYFGHSIEYVGPLDDKGKVQFYENALASIIPIRIGDCFSLVRVEPLACGTPVVTLDVGSAREAVTEGKTGYLIPYSQEEKQMVYAMMKKVVLISQERSISSHVCREDVENRFDWKNLSQKYLDLYESVSERIEAD